MLTSDTLNAKNVQLTTREASYKTCNRTVSLEVNIAKEFESAIIYAENGTNIQTIVEKAISLKEKEILILKSAEHSLAHTSPSITLKEALDALRQVRI